MSFSRRSTTARIRSVTKSFHTADGQEIGVELEKDDGTTISLSISSEVLEDIIGNLTRLWMRVSYCGASEGNPVSITASQVQGVIGGVADDGKHIILTLMTTDGIFHNYGLSVEKIADLRAEITDSKKKLENAPNPVIETLVSAI